VLPHHNIPENKMYHTTNPEEMSQQERDSEVAAILARGFLRLQKITMQPVENSAEKPEKQLDVSGHQSVHGTEG
jgi:hypothetical protein